MEAVVTSSPSFSSTGRLAERPAHNPPDKALVRRLVDLFEGKASGNMGPELYQNGGADLFERLTQSQAYNPYAGEIRLIDENKGHIHAWAESVESAIIIGPGPANSVKNKELPILRGLPNLREVHVIELSRVFNAQSSALLQEELSGVQVFSHTKDFMRMDRAALGDVIVPSLLISTGSLTNYENCATDRFPSPQLKSHLRAFRKLAGDGGKVLWGYDSHLGTGAYEDPLVSEFLLYPLKRVARIDGVSIDPLGFTRRSDCHQQASLVAHAWVATQDQMIDIPGDKHWISEGDKFTIFCSVKPCPDKVKIFEHIARLRTHEYKTEQAGAVLHAFDCV